MAWRLWREPKRVLRAAINAIPIPTPVLLRYWLSTSHHVIMDTPPGYTNVRYTKKAGADRKYNCQTICLAAARYSNCCQCNLWTVLMKKLGHNRRVISMRMMKTWRKRTWSYGLEITLYRVEHGIDLIFNIVIVITLRHRSQQSSLVINQSSS